MKFLLTILFALILYSVQAQIVAIDNPNFIGNEANINVFPEQATYLFKSGIIDYDKSLWNGESGDTTYSPRFVNSYCLSFNGSTSFISFYGSYVPNITDISITAKLSTGVWQKYSSVNAPTGLYSISGSTLYIGKNGTSFFSGEIARVVCLNITGDTLKDIPLSNGYGTSILYGQLEYTIDGTVLVANLENGALLDVNANGAPDALNVYTNFTTTATTMVDAGINGWGTRHNRIDITTKGAGSYYFQQCAVTPGTQQIGGAVIIRYKTNITSNNGVTVTFSTYGSVPAQYLSLDGSETIKIDTFYFKGNLTQFTLYISGMLSVGNGSYFEYDLIKLRKYYSTEGVITSGTWSASCPVFHANMEFGCDIYLNGTDKLYIPKENGVSTNYIGVFKLWHSYTPRSNCFLDVETKLYFPYSDTLHILDTGNYVLTELGDSLIFSYDMLHNYGGYFFANTYNLDTGVYDIRITTGLMVGNKLHDILRNQQENRKDIRVDYTGEYLYITTKTNSGKYLTRVMNQISVPYKFEFACTSVSDSKLTVLNRDVLTTSSQIKNENDDYCPMNFNSTYIGANHGSSWLTKITLAGHGKDASDIGSVWSNNGKTYKLLRITGDNLYFIMVGLFYSNPYYNKINVTGGTLVHVSGAVHTADISAASVVVSQTHPDTFQSYTIYADGVQVDTGFIGYCKVLDVNVSESIYNIFKMENYWPDNMVNSGVILNRMINYKYSGNGSLINTETIESFCDTIYVNNYTGFDQAGGMNILYPTVSKLFYYIPGTVPFTIGANTYTFDSIMDVFSGINDAIYLTVEKRELNRRVERVVMTIANADSSLYNFSHGYITPRKTVWNVSNRDWYILTYTTSKSYPYFITNRPMNSGFKKTVKTFRTYFESYNRNDSASYSYSVRTTTGFRLYIDLHKKATNHYINVPKECEGYYISVFDRKEGLHILSNQITAKGVQVTNDENYGFAILDLY